MRNSLSFCVAAAIAFICTTMGSALGADPSATTVFIECKTPAGVSRGSGVVVSPDGHVLTARHVLGLKPNDPIPDSLECAGSIGVADTRAARAMIAQPISVSVDAALLQFQETRAYDFVKVCKFENWMIRKRIFVVGFPGKTETGSASFREGVLSTAKRNQRGVLETDGQTIAGMSGGPVFSANLRGLIGIVIGARYSPEGVVDYFGILPIEDRYVSPLQLTVSDEPCYHMEREVPTSDLAWRSGMGPVKLGVRADEGVCSLGKVWGTFNDDADEVGVSIENGEYVLSGKDRSGGNIGASAHCVWYD